MTTFDERWRLVNRYLDEALDVCDEERESWLNAFEKEHPEIAREVRELVREHEAIVRERFLEHAPERPSADPTLVGQAVGAYTIVSPIGQGGMGAVWLAERSDGRFDRRAAVKFLSVALTGRGDERFRREGAILARLQHPHIAQLLDAGVSPTGHPYLVLEYVDGEPIDRYCDEHGLDVQARIALFIDVLSAVGHAHANLVVHRDLKPSNVFVSRDGTVKLLDFGVAKLVEVEHQGVAASPLTLAAGPALTPQYAAPEQLTGEAVSTAADIYSLGVLLYTLLTGQHPTAHATQSTAALIQAVIDEEPTRASDVVCAGAPHETLVDCAARRGTTPEKLRRQLRGDLDTILAKALKKAPAERYATVDGFSADLQRHLRHQPISAKKDTVAYRASKFVRRNWLPVTVAIAVFIGLVAGLVVINRARLAAEHRFRQLRQLSAKVFEFDNAIRNLPGSTAARRQLVATALEYLESLSTDVGGDPDLARELAEGYWRIGRVQGVPTEANLGDSSGAEQSLAKADAMANRFLALRPADTGVLVRSAAIAQDRMIVADSEGRRADAQRYARLTVERVQKLLRIGKPSDQDKSFVSTVIGNAALAHLNLHMYADAEREARIQLEISRAVRLYDANSSFALSLLASARRYQGNLEGALEAIREARDIAEHASFPSEIQRTLEVYGVLLRQGLIEGEDGGISFGRSAAAVEILQQAFDMTQAAADRDPNDSATRGRAGTSGRELANILRRSDPKRALEVYDAAIARLAEIRSGNIKARRDRALTLAESSEALRRLQRLAEARRRVDEAVSILTETKNLPADRLSFEGPAYVVLTANIDQLDEEGYVGRALEECRRVMTLVLPSTDAEHDLRDATTLSGLYARLMRLYRRAGDTSGAETIMKQRTELWQVWSRRLGDNAFVERQLEAAQAAQAR